MIYREDDGRLHIDLCEFVALARRGISEHVPTDDEEPHRAPRAEEQARRRFGGEPYRALAELSAEPYSFALHVRADCAEEERLSFLCLTDVSPAHPPREWTAQMRAEAYVCGYVYAKEHGFDRVMLTFLYENSKTGEQKTVEERVTLRKLDAFLSRCLSAVRVFAAPSVERVTERLPSLRALRFPYEQIRDGQDAFMKSVYHAARHGTHLCAEAPTGIGKTVSVLYPALRALGEGGCDKIFYFTPKGTTAEGARTCLEDLVHVGARLRAIVLGAKEKTCQNGLVCRERKADCRLLASNRLAEAALALYKEAIPVVTREQLHRTSRTFGICPYELSLTYAQLCDVVICDVNYLFDPVVYLRRFFDRGGRYAFLIDEAHNLPDRVRDMYSISITDDELLAADDAFGEHSALTPVMTACHERFRQLLHDHVKSELRTNSDGVRIGFTHGRRVPSTLFEIFDELTLAAEGEVFAAHRDKTDAGDRHRRVAKDFYYRIKRLNDTLALADRGYEWFMWGEDGHYTLKLFCIDPSAIIEERLGRGRSAVLFSATLSPIGYYTSLFGLGRSTDTLSVESPFDPDRLCISVMDKISTRYSERERTLGAVLRAVAATVSVKRGHYMVFCPSFAYSDALCEAFRKRYPSIRTLQQRPDMTAEDTRAFLDAFNEDGAYLVAFCVMGGIYAEGIDLCGDRLIGAIIVGVGMPRLCVEREAMAAYFEERYEEGTSYAYLYPGLNKVLQAAGRVIRTEEDRGVLVLIDDRFADPVYKKSIPKRFHSLKFVPDATALNARIKAFWAKTP